MKDRQAQYGLLACVVVVVVVVVASLSCRGQRAVEEPEPASVAKAEPEAMEAEEQAAQAPPAVAAAEPPAAARGEPDPRLLGAWCLHHRAKDQLKTRAGSQWELHPDFTFTHGHPPHLERGTWSHSGRENGVELSGVGSYRIKELSDDTLVLEDGLSQSLHLERECSPEYKAQLRVKALVAAAEGQPLDTIREALERGVDVNATDTLGKRQQTALMAAARHGRVEVVQLLLQRGARHDTEVLGESAMSLAEKSGHDDVIVALARAGAPTTHPAAGEAANGTPPPERTAEAPRGEPANDQALLLRALQAADGESLERIQQTVEDIEQRFPEEPGMTEQERRDLGRQRAEALTEALE